MWELRRNFVFKKLSSEGKGKSEKDGRGLLKTLTALDESASHKVLEFRFGHSKCHLFSLQDGNFWQKWIFSDHKKWHFKWPNRNSKTTFRVQTFPKYGLYDFYLVNLSLLGAILAIFQFCGFSGLFWPFFPCNCNV